MRCPVYHVEDLLCPARLLHNVLREMVGSESREHDGMEF
jgi:hypothetical protein